MSSSLLKLDGRTAKGKKWKEYLDSDQELRQGILISSKLCSYCNTCPDIKAETIKCCNCGELYHNSCVLSPLKLDYIKDISENPCLLWCCLDCLSIKNDSDKSMAVNSGNEYLRKSDLKELMLFVHNAITGLKSDIVKHVDSKIENTLSKNVHLSSVTETIPETNPDTVTVANIDNAGTFADIVKCTTNAVPQTNAVGKPLHKEANVVHPKYDNSNNVILLKPNEGKQKPCDETIKLINSSIQGLGVDYCRSRKSGVIALKVSDEKDKHEIIDRLNKNLDLSTNYKAKLSQEKQLPKVTVTGISKLVFDGCDENDTDGMKDILVQDILTRNVNLRKVMESADADKKESIEVVLLKKITHRDGDFTYTAALKVSSKVRYAIHLLGDKLFIFLNRCKVFDRFYVTQCYHCQKVGHTQESCNEKSSQPICRFCTKRHNSYSCDVKDNAEAHCCVNCLASDDDDHRLKANGHTASSLKCPYLQRCIQHVKQNTVDWLPKNC